MTTEHEQDSNINDLHEFSSERAKVKRLLAQAGGQSHGRRDTWINVIFLVIMLVVFVLGITTKFIPSFLLIEIGVLLVSFKIIFMIHSQQKVYHFQFWILNSIEFRLNEVARRVKKIETELGETNKDN